MALAASDISSVIVLAKPENRGEPATVDETIKRRQIAGSKHVDRKCPGFLEIPDAAAEDSLPSSQLRSLTLLARSLPARPGSCVIPRHATHVVRKTESLPQYGNSATVAAARASHASARRAS